MLLWAHCSDTAVVERGEPRLTQDRQRRETEREAKREAERESNRERDRKGERGERERAQGRARRVVDKAQGSAVTSQLLSGLPEPAVSRQDDQAHATKDG